MIIRPATQRDKKKVLNLFDEFSLFLGSKERPSRIGQGIFKEIINRSDTKIFIADEKGILQGVVTFYVLPNITRGWHRGHIEDFFVTESARNKGIGTELLSYVKKYCKKHNIKVIKVNSSNKLPAAHMFYEKNGGITTERFFRFDIL